jgi:uncharacterized protein (TIGR03437 family)
LRHAARAIILLSTLACLLRGQPGIGQNGVVNSASQIPPTLPGGAIARGALFTVTGVRLGSSAGKTTVAISRQGVSLPVQVISLQPKKLEALMPSTAPLGSNDLTITVDGRESRPFPVEVVAFNPGIFSRDLEGWGAGRIDNLDAAGKRSDNSLTNPAHPGQRVTLATTGMGGAKEATVVVGIRPVKGQTSSGGARNGEERLTFDVPADAPSGCWVPVYLQAGPLRASNVVTMSIQKGAGHCDPGPVPIWSTKNVILVALSRSRLKAMRQGAPDAARDEALIAIRTGGEEPLLSHNDLPPPGTCIASTSSYQTDEKLALSVGNIAVPNQRGLNAGRKLTLIRQGAAQGQEATRDIGDAWGDQGNYRDRLGFGGAIARRGMPDLFLEPGDYRLVSGGGSDVGAFDLPLTFPAPFQWTDQDETTTVNRSKGVTLHWTNAPGSDTRDQLMVIFARNVDRITTAIGMCICSARASAGQFTVPPAMLANIPLSIDAPGERYDKLVVASLSTKQIKPLGNPSTQIKGLNSGTVFATYDTGRVVDYR